MTTEEFKHAYTICVLKKSPMFVYRVDGTASVNLILRYVPETDFLAYVPLMEELGEDCRMHVNGELFQGRVFTIHGDILYMSLSDYINVITEYHPKNFLFRWENERKSINSLMYYAQVI